MTFSDTVTDIVDCLLVERVLGGIIVDVELAETDGVTIMVTDGTSMVLRLAMMVVSGILENNVMPVNVLVSVSVSFVFTDSIDDMKMSSFSAFDIFI